MNAAIELHDSVVEAINVTCGAVTIKLSAYVHRTEGRPGIDAGSGWSQDVELAFGNGAVEHRPNNFPCTLFRSEVTGLIGATGMIPLPCYLPSNVRLEAIDTMGDRLTIRGNSLEARAVSDGEYVERFPGCSTG